MSNGQLRVLAGVVTIGVALGAYVLQPPILALFASPELVAGIVGGLMVILNLLSNWLPSVTGLDPTERN